MLRPKSLSLVALALVGLPLFLSAACSSNAEYQLLQKYFQAARLRDNTTLGNIATVSFSPTEQGIVQSFTIVRSGDEQRRPLKIRELAAAEDAARQADAEFAKQKRAYQDSNLDAIERVVKAERESKQIRGADAAVQAAWTKWRDDQRQSQLKLAEARKAASAERSMAQGSVYDARNPVDLAQFDGDLVTKDLVVRAMIKKGDAAPVERDLHVRLTKAQLKNGPNGKSVNGRWIITQISEGDEGSAPTS